tara:strand:- start:470 stop:862 length:393 start_codon:yes stop_codon:yes gene_type:complete
MSSRDFSAWKAGLLICGLLFLGKVNGEAASLEYGVYLTIQAESGEILYEKNCARCHPVNFYEDIAVGWHGMSVLDYFYRIRGSMPADSPRSLTDIEYLELVAWVLSVNGYPSGGQPLQAKSYLGLLKFGE